MRSFNYPAHLVSFYKMQNVITPASVGCKDWTIQEECILNTEKYQLLQLFISNYNSNFTWACGSGYFAKRNVVTFHVPKYLRVLLSLSNSENAFGVT